VTQIRQRKCEEHGSCQLQSVDGEPWEHTHQRRTLAERFRLVSAPTRREVEAAGLSRRVTEVLRDSERRGVHLGELLAEADKALDRLEQRLAEKSQIINAVYRAATEAHRPTKEELLALDRRVSEMERIVKLEREERLAMTHQTITSTRSLAARIEDMRAQACRKMKGKA
jgi:hypothetical protein